MTADTVEATVAGHRVEADLYGDGEAGALLIHGLASDRRAWGPAPEHLAREGFTALAVDLRGHGASEGPRGLLARGRVLADLDTWVDVLEAHGAELSLAAGHSVGGLWAMLLAEARSLDAVAAIASPATLRDQVPWFERVAYRAGGAVDRLVRAAGGSPLTVDYDVTLEDTLDHPRAIARWQDEGLPMDRLPLANAKELLTLDGTGLAKRVHAPTLVAHGARDTLVARESTHAIYEALPGERTWMELPGPHDVFLDVEADECARRVAAWARDTVPDA